MRSGENTSAKETLKSIILAQRRRGAEKSDKLLPRRAQRDTEEKLLLTWMDRIDRIKALPARLFFT